MKIIAKMLCIGAVAILCSTSCKKQNAEQETKNINLEKNEDFRNYVATDLLSRVRVSQQIIKQVKTPSLVSFQKKLSVASESSIISIFHDHNLEYTFFQKHVISRVIRRARIIEKIHLFFDNLSDEQVDTRMNEAYKNVAIELLEMARSKYQSQLFSDKNTATLVRNANSSENQSPVQVKKSISMIDDSVEDYYLLNDFETSLPIDVIVDDITIGLAKTNTDGLTIGETWNCFKNAMGFGGLGMGGVASWARLSAGMQIQELIAFATKWAMKHIGWIGAALAIADFGVCIYDSI